MDIFREKKALRSPYKRHEHTHLVRVYKKDFLFHSCFESGGRYYKKEIISYFAPCINQFSVCHKKNSSKHEQEQSVTLSRASGNGSMKEWKKNKIKENSAIWKLKPESFCWWGTGKVFGCWFVSFSPSSGCGSVRCGFCFSKKFTQNWFTNLISSFDCVFRRFSSFNSHEFHLIWLCFYRRKIDNMWWNVWMIWMLYSVVMVVVMLVPSSFSSLPLYSLNACSYV